MILCLGATPAMQRTMSFSSLRVDGVNRAAETRDYASGKSVNVAKVLTTLGHDALATGFAGGRRGRALRDALDQIQVRHDFVDVQSETRQCITVIDRASGRVTELVEEAPAVAEEDWINLESKVASRIGSAEACVFSGSLPPGAPLDFYARCLRLRGEPRPFTLIDARGEPLRMALAEGEFIAKLNREELESTIDAKLGSDLDLHAAMRQTSPADGGLIVTFGAEGATAWLDSKFWHVRMPMIKVLSPVGSGDAFAAGFTAAQVRGLDTAHALALAAACGAANAMTPDSGVLHLKDLELILPRVIVSTS